VIIPASTAATHLFFMPVSSFNYVADGVFGP